MFRVMASDADERSVAAMAFIRAIPNLGGHRNLPA
jgi:hypothetical protein